MQHPWRFSRRQAWRLAAALLLSAALLGTPAVAQAQNSGSPIAAEGAVYLVRTTLIALSQANETGNYTVLRDLGAPGFRQANDAARLAAIFASLRENGVDLSYAALAEPVFSADPQLTTENMLHLAGTVPGGSPPIAFEFLFQPVDGSWRLFGVSVNPAQPGGPALPSPAPRAEGEDEAEENGEAGTP